MYAACHRRGFSTLELMIVIAIVSSLAVIGCSAYGDLRLSLYETECRQQLSDMNTALAHYREEHRGQDPPNLTVLVPDYLPARALVCPLVRARAAQVIADLEANATSGPYPIHWTSYGFYQRKGLDDLARRGELPFGYSHVLSLRGGDTPVIICQDHRQPYSLFNAHRAGPGLLRSWYHPERSNLVLRSNGRIDRSRYGGLFLDGVYMDGMSELMGM
jgi:prepilin-type N-terminal cleavage/methylation domain-containing protein